MEIVETKVRDLSAEEIKAIRILRAVQIWEITKIIVKPILYVGFFLFMVVFGTIFKVAVSGSGLKAGNGRESGE